MTNLQISINLVGFSGSRFLWKSRYSTLKRTKKRICSPSIFCLASGSVSSSTLRLVFELETQDLQKWPDSRPCWNRSCQNLRFLNLKKKIANVLFLKPIVKKRFCKNGFVKVFWKKASNSFRLNSFNLLSLRNKVFTSLQ